MQEENSALMVTNRGRIQPIPSTVAVQIKSSTNVNSLADVVIGLLRNSLDAGATTINLETDFEKCCCFCEDDGEGIDVYDLGPEGLLGVSGATSKLDRTEVYGTCGCFLAYAASLGEVNIVSCRADQPLKRLNLRDGKRLVDTTASLGWHQLTLGASSGTMVSVNDLFRSMLVRLKCRASFGEAERTTEQADLLHRVTALLLAWHNPIRLRLRSKEPPADMCIDTRTNISDPAWRFNQDLVFRTLAQAGLIAPTSKTSFVPIAAKRSSISVKGVISLDPSPTKQLQFIAIGAEPANSSGICSDLVDVINRIFNDSRFGVIESHSLDDLEQARRRQDHRFKQDGFTGVQTRAGGKGVDRWPIFCLQVRFTDALNGRWTSGGVKYGSEARLMLIAITNIIGRAVTEWLQQYDFRPRKWRKMHTASKSTAGLHPDNTILKYASRDNVYSNDESKLAKVASVSELRPGKPVEAAPELEIYEAVSERKNVTGSQEDLSLVAERNLGLDDPICDAEYAEGCRPSETCQMNYQRGSTTSVEALTLSNGLMSAGATPASHYDVEDINTGPAHGASGNVVTWKDPASEDKYILNTQSGMIRPWKHASAQHMSCSVSTSESCRVKPFRQFTDCMWAKSLIGRWNNPVFNANKANIAFIRNDTFAAVEIKNRAAELSGELLHSPEVCRVSTLKGAQAVAQVDKKFILVKSMGALASLILIDQHAASERVTVEKLFGDLCRPCRDGTPTADRHIESNLRYSSDVRCTALTNPLIVILAKAEVELCRAQAVLFARWGVLFNLHSDPASPSQANAAENASLRILEVIAMPKLIVERYALEPMLMGELIRSVIHDDHCKKTLEPPPSAFKKQSWVKDVADCPHQILEVLKSRACRSAIMFNDVLSQADCTRLINDLKKGAYPLVCAHGRPSVVPLVQ